MEKPQCSPTKTLRYYIEAGKRAASEIHVLAKCRHFDGNVLKILPY